MFGYCQTLLTHMDFLHAWGTNEVAVQVGSIVYSFNLGGNNNKKKHGKNERVYKTDVMLDS